MLVENVDKNGKTDMCPFELMKEHMIILTSEGIVLDCCESTYLIMPANPKGPTNRKMLPQNIITPATINWFTKTHTIPTLRFQYTINVT